MLLSVPLTMVLKIMLESSTRWSPWAILLDTPEDVLKLAAAGAGEAPGTLSPAQQVAAAAAAEALRHSLAPPAQTDDDGPLDDRE
jgi:hypothetical protein